MAYNLHKEVQVRFSFEKFGAFEEWKNEAKPALEKIMGLDNLYKIERKAIIPQRIWQRENAFGTVERIEFETEPGFRTFAYVCIPAGAKPPFKTFICLQGHSTGMHNSIAVDWKDETSKIAVEGDRDLAIGCMKRGITAVCLEQRYMGGHSTNVDHSSDCWIPTMNNIMSGRRTTLAERVYDVDRLIDYLETRGDIDRRCIGITGNSGGGTTSMFAGGLLDRITHVMPSSAFSSFHASIAAIKHCVCNHIPHLLEYGESADVVGLGAPKPLVIVQGALDSIFPKAGAEEQFARLKKIYAAAGNIKNCNLVVGPEGHRYYADIAWAAMSKYL